MNNLDIINGGQVKRKRGRPRKNVVTQPKIKKKRGRKPKNTIDTPSKINIKKNYEECEIILKLPINNHDIEKYSGNTDNEDIVTSVSPSSIRQNNSIFTINDVSDNESSDDTLNNYELINKLKEQDYVIEQLQKEIELYKDMLNKKNSIIDWDSSKIKELSFDFIDKNTKQIITNKKTDIACWWCTYCFNNSPCFLPEEFYDDKFFVSGCFCSNNCAAAYNIDMDDYKVWDRQSLINKINYLTTKSIEPVKIAPPRQCLTKFGGHMTIEQFRYNNNEEIRIILPPMVPIIPLIENSKNSIFGVSLTRKSPENLILKRSRPLPNAKTNLIETMGIKKRLKK